MAYAPWIDNLTQLLTVFVQKKSGRGEDRERKWQQQENIKISDTRKDKNSENDGEDFFHEWGEYTHRRGFVKRKYCKYRKNHILSYNLSSLTTLFMNLLQAFFIVSGFIISIISFDIAKRQKFNALHFLVFIGIGIGLFVFTVFPNILNMMGHLFWLQRGADVLVYVSIVFLFYFVLLLLNKAEKNREDITRLVREIGVLEDKLRQHDHK